MLLEVQDLCVTYTGQPPVRAVRDVNFTLDGGQTLGVAGESGSGKTTMALALLRLLPASAKITGKVLFEGEDLVTSAWGRLRAVRWNGASVVFQGAMGALNPVRTIDWQIREAITQHDHRTSAREVTKRIKELLGQVGLPASRISSYPHELSGGQRQRVMIAMALACRPNLVIADEPTTALDVIVQGQVLGLLKGLVSEAGIGLIMISHDLAVIAETCDYAAVMYHGRILEYGRSHDVVLSGRHPYTRALAGAFPQIGDMASRLAPSGLPGDPPDASAEFDGCSFAPRCPLVSDRCLTERPAAEAVADGHVAACFRANEVQPKAGQGAASA